MAVLTLAEAEARLVKVRALCLALEGAEEKLSHGMPAFQARGRMFAYFWRDHHGDGLTAVCVKTTGRDEQDMLMEAAPEVFSRPPYLGPSGWLNMDLTPEEPDWDHVAGRLAISHALATGPRTPRSKRSS